MKRILRIFSTDKLVRIPILNRVGLQIFRILSAHWVYRYLRPKLKLNSEHFKFLSQNGYLKLDNFLSEDEFQKVYRDYEKLKESKEWEKFGRKDGPNMIYLFNFSGMDKTAYPHLFQFLKNDTLINLFKALERKSVVMKPESSIIQFQYLVQGEDDGTFDPETALHADTFFNTHKAWFYFDDVNIENAPFVYVPGTNNIFIPNRLKREYKYSIASKDKGSRRIELDELNELGLKEEVLTCSRNTLLIANTLGYHRRLKGKPGCDRPSIAISVRLNPFKP